MQLQRIRLVVRNEGKNTGFREIGSHPIEARRAKEDSPRREPWVQAVCSDEPLQGVSALRPAFRLGTSAEIMGARSWSRGLHEPADRQK